MVSEVRITLRARPGQLAAHQEPEVGALLAQGVSLENLPCRTANQRKEPLTYEIPEPEGAHQIGRTSHAPEASPCLFWPSFDSLFDSDFDFDVDFNKQNAVDKW